MFLYSSLISVAEGTGSHRSFRVWVEVLCSCIYRPIRAGVGAQEGDQAGWSVTLSPQVWPQCTESHRGYQLPSGCCCINSSGWWTCSVKALHAVLLSGQAPKLIRARICLCLGLVELRSEQTEKASFPPLGEEGRRQKRRHGDQLEVRFVFFMSDLILCRVDWLKNGLW